MAAVPRRTRGDVRGGHAVPALSVVAVAAGTFLALMSGDAFVAAGRAVASRSARLQRLRARAGVTRADKSYFEGKAMIGDGRAPPDALLEGIQIITQAALDGSTLAMTDLGMFYCQGQLGLPKNATLAVDWWERAAAQGNPDAHFNLGISKMLGNGVPLNKFEAGKSFKRAAEGGNLNAMMNLAGMLMRGDGVPQDRDLANQWLVRAWTARGDDMKDILTKLGGDGLSPEEKMALQANIERIRDKNAQNNFMKSPNTPDDDEEEWSDDRGQV